MLVEILIVFLLTLVNGVLAMSELAIVSSRPARLKVMAEGGSRGAATALRLADDPGRFLSSVQIGITMVGVLAGAFSGATLGVRLASALAGAGVSSVLAQAFGVGGVVVLITYVSLIFGELVPKQIALRAPETVATRVAPLLNLIAIVAAPVVWVLDRSGKIVLALLGQSGAAERNMTDEEVKLVLSEAQSAGVMEKAETEMIAGVMRFADRNAKGLMVPRHEVDVVDIDEAPSAIIRRFRDTGHSRLPVRDGSAPSSGPPRQSGTPAALTARTGPADARLLRALRRASPFFCQQFLHCRHVEHLLGQQLLQLGVLVFERLQPLGLGHRHAGILRLPSIERAFRHAMLAAQIGALRAGLMLMHDTNDLLFGSYRSLHRPSLPWGRL